jgi:parallel beta-helix repeat protein
MLITIGSVSAINTKPTQTQSKGDTLYVGGTGPGNYTHIQDAINNASGGDKIIVFYDIYYENIIINKPLHIKGIPSITQEKPVIDSNEIGNAIEIKSEDCIIEGFVITNFGDYYDYGTGIFVKDNSRNCIIIDNIIKGNSNWGIKFQHENDNSIVENNTIRGLFYGIDMYSGSGTEHIRISNNIFQNNIYSGNICGNFFLICNNTFDNNRQSLYLRPANNAIIRNNTFTNNRDGPSIEAYTSRNTIFEDNSFFNNTYYAIFCNIGNGLDYAIIRNNTFDNNRGGLYIEYSDYYKIINNKFTNHTIDGIFLGHKNAEFILIKNNICKYNGQAGIHLDNTKGQIVEGNYCANNEYGIVIRSNTWHTVINRYITISNNTVKNNLKHGIYFQGLSRECKIIHNQIEENQLYGIYMSGIYHDVTNNNFINNNDDATFQRAFYINWESNYWNEPLDRKVINGKFGFWIGIFPWKNYDRNPAQEPFEIGEFK